MMDEVRDHFIVWAAMFAIILFYFRNRGLTK